MSHVTTHVLDTAAGVPAAGVRASLIGPDGAVIAEGSTDDDGRISAFGPDSLRPGVYRIVFDSGSYFERTGTDSFFPQVTIDFSVTDTGRHYHVPLLLSPFAYSTYRGS